MNKVVKTIKGADLCANLPKQHGNVQTQECSLIPPLTNGTHTPNAGRINASNPCSEYMHLDNSACNLASINLLKYLA